MEELLQKQKILMDAIPSVPTTEEGIKRMVSSLGIIEEVLEYLGALGSEGFKKWRGGPLPREKQLEELGDILFYYLELITLSGFTWEEIVQEYHRKWKVNMKRYELASKGDFSWDKRGKGL